MTPSEWKKIYSKSFNNCYDKDKWECIENMNKKIKHCSIISLIVHVLHDFVLIDYKGHGRLTSALKTGN